MHKYDKSRFNFMLEAIKVIKQLAAKTITLKSSYAIFLNLVTLAEAACKVGLEKKKHGIDMYQSIPWESLDRVRALIHQTHLFNFSELCTEVVTQIPKFIQLEEAIQFILEQDQDPKHLFVSDVLNNFIDKVKNEKIDRNITNKLKRSDSEILLTIRAQLENIENFLLDDQKLENEDTLYAVEMAFVIISNQIKEDKVNGTGLSIDFMKKYPLNVPSEGIDPRLLTTWGELLELGNEFIHNYFKINTDYVLTICQTKFFIIKNRTQMICDQVQLDKQSSNVPTTKYLISKPSEKSEIEENISELEEKRTKKQKVSEKPSQQKDLLDELEEEYQPKSFKLD